MHRHTLPVVSLVCHSHRGDLTETIYTHLYHGSSGPALNLTLEGQLLNQWSSGSPHYDALFLQHMPPVDQLLTSLSADAPAITLLVNQSAVSGLPAALNQVTSAILRLMVAAGGAKSSPAPTGSAGTTPAVQLEPTGMQQGRPRVQRTQAALKVQDAAVSGVQSVLGGSRVGGQGRVGGTSSHGGAGGGGHLPSCMPVINTVSSPLPLMAGEEAQRVRQDAGALMLVLCMTLAASVLSASFVVFLVRWVGGWVGASTDPARGCSVQWG